MERKRILASSTILPTFTGPIPEGLDVIHRCRRSCCVNPKHLRLGNRGERDDKTNEEARKKIRECCIPEPNSGCWIFTEYTNPEGYGMLSWNGKRLLAHRLSYIAFVGEIPEGLCVLHRCDTPCCVNPNHLWIGSRGDNNRDMTVKGRHTKINPYCGEINHLSKLTETEVAELLVMRHLRGVSTYKIAKKLGLSRTNVQDICRGRIWKHLTKGHTDVLVFPEGEPIEAFNARVDEMFDYLKAQPELIESVES